MATLDKLFKTCSCGHPVSKHRLNAGGCLIAHCGCRRATAYNGLTLRAVAKKIDIHPSALSRFLNGKRSISQKAFYKLCSEVLKVQPEELLANAISRNQHQA